MWYVSWKSVKLMSCMMKMLSLTYKQIIILKPTTEFYCLKHKYRLKYEVLQYFIVIRCVIKRNLVEDSILYFIHGVCND